MLVDIWGTLIYELICCIGARTILVKHAPGPSFNVTLDLVRIGFSDWFVYLYTANQNASCKARRLCARYWLPKKTEKKSNMNKWERRKYKYYIYWCSSIWDVSERSWLSAHNVLCGETLTATVCLPSTFNCFLLFDICVGWRLRSF